MIINRLKIVYRYTERALTPTNFSNQLQQKLQQNNLKQILHQLNLYNHNILVFDYDYYQQCCYRLLDFQRQIQTQDLTMILKLGVRHNLKNMMLWQHYESQIHARLHRQVMPLLEQQKLQFEKSMKAAFKQFQQNSQDFFNVLKPQFIDEQQQKIQIIQQVSQQVPSQITEEIKLPKINNQTKISNHINQISELLILFGTKNIDLLKLTLQTQTHPKLNKITPESIIKFTQTFVYTCQTLLQEYQQNKNKYTARSIKKIFKFQGLYLPDMLRMLEDRTSEFSNEQIVHLMQVVGSFPIKKRVNRAKITDIIGKQLQKREINLDEYLQDFQNILGADKKLKKRFRANFGLPEPQQQQVLKIQ